MESYKLSSGFEMPLLGLGTWKADNPEELYNSIREAICLGYRHIDCAKIYGNEKIIGKALNHATRIGDVKREDIFITSKLWNDSHAKEHVLPSLESTLQDLQLEYLDLYLIHWPVALKKGTLLPKSSEDYIPLEHLPVSDTWCGMEKVVEKNLVRSIGVSNFSVKKLQNLYNSTNLKPVVNQVESHPFLQQKDLLAYSKDNNVLLTAYSPLGSRDRASFLVSENEPSLLDNAVITRIAQKHNATSAQVLIKWQMQRGVSVIPKSTNPKRLKENFEATLIELDKDDMDEIAALDKNFRFLTGEFFTPAGSGYTLENLWDE